MSENEEKLAVRPNFVLAMSEIMGAVINGHILVSQDKQGLAICEAINALAVTVARLYVASESGDEKFQNLFNSLFAANVELFKQTKAANEAEEFKPPKGKLQ